MFKISKIAAIAATFAASLALGGSGNAAIDRNWITTENRAYGQWGYSEMYSPNNGDVACEIRTEWRTGQEMRLVVLSEPRSLALLFRDPNAGMQGRGRGVLQVDGAEWSAEFEASGTQLAIARITNVQAARRFLDAFAAGNTLAMALPWGQRVNAGLRGSQAALADMNRCVGRM